MAMNGTIKRLVSDKGFGFIAAGDGTEYFFHQSACVQTAFTAPRGSVGDVRRWPRSERAERRERQARVMPEARRRVRRLRLVNRTVLKLNDIVVSRVDDGYHLFIVTAMPDDEMSLVYRGDGWNVQYAVAKGARLAAGKGGDLWYTADKLTTLEYLETFRADRRQTAVH